MSTQPTNEQEEVKPALNARIDAVLQDNLNRPFIDRAKFLADLVALFNELSDKR
jgi:hypothetical protein